MSGEARLREAVRAAIRASRAHMVDDEAGSSHLVSIEVPFNEWVDMAQALKEEEARALPSRREENRAGAGGLSGRALGRPASSFGEQGEGSSLRGAMGASPTNAGAPVEQRVAADAPARTPGRSAVRPTLNALSNPAGRGGAAGLFFQDWQL